MARKALDVLVIAAAGLSTLVIWLGVVLQGRIEARATDGTGFEIGPGDVVLLEDTWGVGHASRVVGDEDWLALVVVLD